MKEVPDYIFNEMVSITKILSLREPRNRTKQINAIRRAALLYRKLLKYCDNEQEQRDKKV